MDDLHQGPRHEERTFSSSKPDHLDNMLLEISACHSLDFLLQLYPVEGKLFQNLHALRML